MLIRQKSITSFIIHILTVAVIYRKLSFLPFTCTHIFIDMKKSNGANATNSDNIADCYLASKMYANTFFTLHNILKFLSALRYKRCQSEYIQLVYIAARWRKKKHIERMKYTYFIFSEIYAVKMLFLKLLPFPPSHLCNNFIRESSSRYFKSGRQKVQQLVICNQEKTTPLEKINILCQFL